MIIPITQKLKDKWVTALRSGEYTQGRGGLRINDTFCCLGVLCDLIDPTKWTSYTNNHRLHYLYDGGALFPPKNLALSDNIMNKLTVLNDSEECDFNAIANRIEELVEVV